jgi:glutamine cyclotransferase
VRPLGVLLVLGVVLTGCGTSAPAGHAGIIRATATVVGRHPHDPTSFTEGLAFGGRDRLFESSGQYGSSDIRAVDPTTGRVLIRTALPAQMFGEGLGVLHNQVVQLTWREHVALTYDRSTLARHAATYPVANEGWGLSLDSAHHRWVQSDGTATLTFRDQTTFAVTGHRAVTLRGKPVTQLNELEVVGGSVWANVWKSNTIDRIDLATGGVTETVDLSALVPQGLTDGDDVLNGIAHRPGDPVTRLWVTGKRWPTMYEIRISR